MINGNSKSTWFVSSSTVHHGHHAVVEEGGGEGQTHGSRPSLPGTPTQGEVTPTGGVAWWWLKVRVEKGRRTYGGVVLRGVNGGGGGGGGGCWWLTWGEGSDGKRR